MKLSMDDMAKFEKYLIATNSLRVSMNTAAIITFCREVLGKIEDAGSKEEAVNLVKEIIKQKESDLKNREKEVEGKMKQEELAWQNRRLAEIEEFAKIFNLKFSKNKEEIIDEIFKKGGFCPCKREEKCKCGVLCPCRDALTELVRKGECRGGLFVLPENVKKELEPVQDLDVKLPDAIILAKIVLDKEFKKMPEKGKVTVLNFFADWCEPCAILEELLGKIKDKDMVIKRLDVNRDNGLSRRLGIKRVPFVVIFDNSGRAFTAVSGFSECRDKEYLNREEENLKNVISKARKIGQ